MIEVLVVIGLFAMIGGFALWVTMEQYRGSSFYGDRNLLIAALERARSEAINNVCLGSSCIDGMPHGVHIQSDAFIVFQGSTYNPSDSNNARFDANASIAHTLTTPSADIIFSQLTGTTSAVGDIGLAGQGKVSTTTITADGRIYWDH